MALERPKLLMHALDMARHVFPFPERLLTDRTSERLVSKMHRASVLGKILCEKEGACTANGITSKRSEALVHAQIVLRSIRVPQKRGVALGAWENGSRLMRANVVNC